MDYNVSHYGAAGDGVARDTAAIQSAIDACSQAGGGRVILTGGVFLSGTLYLKSFVNLHIDSTAVLLGSDSIDDYGTDTFRQLYRKESHMDRCLIFASHAEHVALSGGGVIDGQGGKFANKPAVPGDPVPERPMMTRFFHCSDVRLSGLRMRNPASWTNAFLYCRDVWAEGLDIVSRANYNGDGLDFDGCDNVFVSNCKLDCSDDCICLQASDPAYPCRHIAVINTLMRSQWAGMRIGLLSCGDIENVTVSNCIFRDIDCSALKIQSAEGGAIRRMTFSNLVMDNVQRPIFITLNHFREHGGRSDPVPLTGRVEQLQFSHITAVCKPDDPKFLRSCLILDGLPDHPLRSISITDMQYTAAGGGAAEDAAGADIPGHEGCRAECFNYGGALPAYGIFARHVRDLSLERVRIDTLRSDERPWLTAIDCTCPVVKNENGPLKIDHLES